MVSKLILRIEENGKLVRDIGATFTNPDKTKECYDDAKKAIYKCGVHGDMDDITFMKYHMNLEEDLQNLLNKMEIGVNTCDLNTLNISNNIIEDLAIFGERKKVVRISVDDRKIREMINRFKSLRDEFYTKCQCGKR